MQPIVTCSHSRWVPPDAFTLPSSAKASRAQAGGLQSATGARLPFSVCWVTY